MTEAEWGTCVDPVPMLQFLHSKGSNRLWRLFAVACVRRVEHLMRDPRSWKALEVAERFADGDATEEELNVARVGAGAAAYQAHYDEYIDEIRANFRWDAAYEEAWIAAQAADAAFRCVAADADIGEAKDRQVTVVAEGLQQPDLLREVFGNPFRWIIIDPVWLSRDDGAVRKLRRSSTTTALSTAFRCWPTP